ncbi:MAG: glycosyltransferase [Clostridiales bacterium]
MKIALVHDGIYCRAGGERVLLNFHNAFPDAPIYTAMYAPEDTFPEFKKCDIRTTWFQKIASNEVQYKKYYYPFCIWAMKSLDLSEYDVLLMTTTHCAKYVKASSRTLVVAYCFTPFRLAWNPESYTLYSNSKGVKRIALNMLIDRLKTIDYRKAQRPDRYIAMTQETRNRLIAAYDIRSDIDIINPPINVNKYRLSANPQNYYLVVSRLEKYKKVDLVIEAFNKLGYELKIIGRGTEKEHLKRIAHSNITFIEGISDFELAEYYSNCKAFIFPQFEDYGLTPLEAIASGRPVIAYNKGGVLETMLPYEHPEKPFTAVFFDEQTVDSLMNAVHKLENLKYDTSFIRNHSEKFHDTLFEERIKEYIVALYNERSK